jgi:COMPASS component SWD2
MVPAGQRNAVSYWSLHDNKILRKFRGHQDKVTFISMSPADDTFLTSSMDRTVRLWNIQQAGGIAELKMPAETSGGPVACYDSTGLVFGVSAMMADAQGHYVHLYDARNYGAGAFAEFKVSTQDVDTAIQSQTGMQSGRGLGKIHSFGFNMSGSQILLGGEHGHALVLDGFEGAIQRAFTQANRSSDGPLPCCFASDDKTLLQARDDGSIACWDLSGGASLQNLQGHQTRINCLASNPRYSQIASSCTQTCLWLL